MKDFIIQEIENLVGVANVLTQEEDRWTYAYDATEQAHAPDAGGLSRVGGGNFPDSGVWPTSTASR